MKLIPLALALSLLPFTAAAQDAPKAAAPQSAPKAQTQAVPLADFGAERGVFDDQKAVGVLTGNVTATQQGEDFILYSQKAVWYRDQNKATATQDLRIETRESTIRAEQLFADFNTKVFSMTGSVRVTSYGDGDGVVTDATAQRRADAKRKPVRIACDRLDWNYDTRQATLVGNIRIVQADSVGTCDRIIYDEPTNAAQLIGNVRFGNTKRQQFLANELLLFVDSGLVQTNAGVRVTGPVDNAADGVKVAPKVATKFPTPAAIGADVQLPTPPPDIDKFLPKPKAKTPAQPATPATPATPTPEAPATAPAVPQMEKPESEQPIIEKPAAENVPTEPTADVPAAPVEDA